MEEFTYAPETAGTASGGGGGARAARAASDSKSGGTNGGGWGSRGGQTNSSGPAAAPHRNRAWVAGSNSKHTFYVILFLPTSICAPHEVPCIDSTSQVFVQV